MLRVLTVNVALPDNTLAVVFGTEVEAEEFAYWIDTVGRAAFTAWKEDPDGGAQSG